MYQTTKQPYFQSKEQHEKRQHLNLPCQHQHRHHHHRHYRCFRRCGLLWLIFFTMIRVNDASTAVYPFAHVTISTPVFISVYVRLSKRLIILLPNYLFVRLPMNSMLIHALIPLPTHSLIGSPVERTLIPLPNRSFILWPRNSVYKL
uniref:Uncharacterized protein n=1 Tax=Glossina brevipalpis TaxID=37001 RepID=A0A1A9WMR3_9MUSC